MTVAISPKKIIEDFILKYLRLPEARRKRVDLLFELMKRSNDFEEQKEIANAIQEIVDPPSDYSLAPVDPEEGVPADAIAKVLAYRSHIGQAIRNRRKELNMTQEQLAAKSGLPQSHICRLEIGRHAPTAQTIERLAVALEMDPSKLDLLYEPD